jgi:hypothetical protein
LPGTPSPEPDGVVNVQELSLIQNIILTGFYPDGTSLGSNSFEKISDANFEEDARVTFYINNEGIKADIDTKVGIRGAQIEFANVNNNPGNIMISTDLGQGFYFYVTSNQLLRTLLYDPLGEKYIEPGKHFLAEMPFLLEEPEKVTIEKIILVDIHREKLLSIQVEMVYGDPTPLPQEYLLYQNYPNPFNPGTVIEFTLPEDVSNARLSIYNALGEKVDELVNTSLQAGYHRYQWDAKDFATGMYIYELRTEKYVAVKKMVLVK